MKDISGLEFYFHSADAVFIILFLIQFQAKQVL